MPNDMEVNTVSTVIPESTGPEASGAGVTPSDLAPEQEPEPKAEKPAKPETVRETLERASKDLKKETEDAKLKEEKAEGARDDKAAKTEETKDTAKDEAKAEPDAEQRAAEKPATERDDKAETRQSGGRDHAEPPARFLPEASVKWANVPNEIKAEFHRVSQETETELAEARKVTERYEAIREFDELAQQNGRDLRHTLERVVNIEKTLAQNPLAGLDMILREIGPRKPDGSPMSLHEVSQFVAQQSPQQLQQIMQRGAQQPQQAPQNDPRVAEMAQQIQQLQQQVAGSTVAPIVEQFAAQHPDFNTLETKIASVLKSGVIEQMYGSGLSPVQRLSEAYRMAGGRPATPSQPEMVEDTTAVERPVNPDAGKKSVRGAPNGGNDPEIDRPETNVRELLVKEMRKLRA